MEVPMLTSIGGGHRYARTNSVGAMKNFALPIMVSLTLVACAFQPARLTLRRVQDPNVCPLAAVPLPMRFRIDPLAQDQVTAVASDGRLYRVRWAPGFVAGELTDPVVRAPNGEVVARDGEVLEEQLLHGYAVCATGDEIYILLV
jgi:hypothetical protein